MSRSCALVVSLVIFSLSGCVPASTGTPAASPPQAGVPSGPKLLTIALQTPKDGYGPWFIGGPPSPLQWEELVTNFLASADASGTAEPWLASKMPSLREQTIEVQPDGRLRITWNLRPNVKWHDGQPFTSDDLKFGWEVMTLPGLPALPAAPVRALQSIETPDPLTAVMTSNLRSLRAVQLGYRELFPLPRHLLGEAAQGPMESFLALPYWTTKFVHTGPFRVKEFTPGEQIVLERFDDYFLGRPKLDGVIIRMIPDNSTVVSNLLAGAVDIAGELPTDLAVVVRDQWAQSHAGFVLSRQAFWRFASIQFNPEWGGPPEVQRDIRARRGLAQSTDYEALRAAVAPGFPDTAGDTFLLAGDPRLATVGRPFARYRYDLPAAARELADAGWRRVADGRMLNASGEQARLNLRVPTPDLVSELSIVAGGWRELGFEVAEELTPAPLRRDNEYNVKFPTMEITAQGPRFWGRFDSRQRPTADNRFTGTNGGSWVNADFDRLIDRIENTLDDNETALILRDMGEILAIELPALPLYFGVRTVLALKHVQGLDDIYGSPGAIGTTAKNSYLWHRV